MEELHNGNNITYLSGILNDLDGGTMFQPEGASFRPKSYFVENGREYIIGLINPYRLIGHIASKEFKNSVPKYPEKKRELERLAKSIQDTDNPIIILIRLKK